MTTFGIGEARAQMSVEQAVVNFEGLVREYNVITSGNLNLNNTHTDGSIAVGGNLTLTGNNVLAMHGNKVGPNPSVYLNGQLSVSGNSYLNNGYVYAPNLNSSTTYTGGSQRSLNNGGSLSYNTSHANSYVDPRNAPAPSGWNLTSTFSELAAISNTLAASSPTGTINFTNNQIVLSTSLTSGVAVFNVDASQLAGVSGINIQINVPADMVYVINVLNAGGQTLFGGSNNNGNVGQNNDQLLWNIVPDSNPNTSNSITLGSNFYGSILAPMIDLNNTANGNNRYVNGQIVAASYTHTGAEIHHVDFSAPVTFSPVPEPSTWGLFGIAGCAMIMLCRRPGARRRLAA
ncbi:MAG: collagen-binding domain-containing protein [Rariglobus sp.]